MSNFLESPNRKSYNSSKEENALREIFYQHWEKMKNQMGRIIEEINQWRKKSIEDINKYADRQIKILHDFYNRQRGVFDEQRRANLETAASYVHHGVKESEMFDQLRQACSALEFQMAKLETIRGDMDFVKVITVDNQTKTTQENSRVKQEFETNDNTRHNEGSSPNPTSGSSDRMNQQPLATGTSNNDSNDNQKTHSTKNDDSSKKCPICFMIYPLSMNQHDRSLHANQHYTDDDN